MAEKAKFDRSKPHVNIGTAASFDRFLCLPLRAAAHSEGKPCAKGCLLRVHAVGRKDEHILLQLRHAAAQSVDRAA